jgi:hypothetical protein
MMKSITKTLSVGLGALVVALTVVAVNHPHAPHAKVAKPLVTGGRSFESTR